MAVRPSVGNRLLGLGLAARRWLLHFGRQHAARDGAPRRGHGSGACSVFHTRRRVSSLLPAHDEDKKAHLLRSSLLRPRHQDRGRRHVLHELLPRECPALGHRCPRTVRPEGAGCHGRPASDHRRPEAQVPAARYRQVRSAGRTVQAGERRGCRPHTAANRNGT